MKLRFQNSIEDRIAFFRFIHARRHAGLAQRDAGRMAVFAFVFTLLVTLLVCYLVRLDLREQPTWSVVLAWCFVFAAALSVAILVFFFRRAHVLRRIAQYARRAMQEDADILLFGERELEVSGDNLIERSKFLEAQLKLAAVEGIESTPDYIFIKIGSVRGYVLPREALDPGELDRFLDELERARRRPPPLPVEAASPTVPVDSIRPSQGW